ncbi:hypothetical protein AeMF1_021401 [Aphanomyces euteiches]|nr:hypothetical protein AeMF1_021401 [Aphanomyces euteiches]
MVPPDKLASLRSVIDAKLRNEGIYDQLRLLIQSNAAQEPTLDQDAMLHQVLDSDIVQQLISSMQDETSTSSSKDLGLDESSILEIPSEGLNLHVKVAGGRAFVDQIEETDNTPTTRSCFQLHVAFQNQRFQSHEVVISSVDPPFDESYNLKLNLDVESRHNVVGLTRWEVLCSISEPMQWVVTKLIQTKNRGDSTSQWQTNRTELVGAAILDWRQVLTSSHPTVHIPLTLNGPMNVPVGILDLRFDLPSVRKSSSMCHNVRQFLQRQKLDHHARQRHLYQACKMWWNDLMQENGASSSISHSIRLFVPDECHQYRLVCSFVTPIQSPYLSTPREAARFVSLLPFERSCALDSGCDTPSWPSLHTFLVLGKGDVQAHAILLASLLLGFHLEAFVCMGTTATSYRLKNHNSNTNNPLRRHLWVATKVKQKILFWEPMTGEVIDVQSPSACPYDRIDCVFNHEQFHVNCQGHCPVMELNWTFYDPAIWKSLDPTWIRPPSSAKIDIQKPAIALTPPISKSPSDFESHFRDWLQNTRQQVGLSTHWLKDLSHSMRMALTSYEYERVFGVTSTVDSDLFQSSIHNVVPPGYTFKGFPVSGIKSSQIERKLLRDVVGREIVHSPSGSSRFGLAVHCVAFPEDIFVLWVMVAVVYKS